MAIDERRIAVLGTGRIGEALIAGLLSSGWRQPDEIAASRRRASVEELRERHGVAATLSNAEAVAGAGVVVLAVKPQDIDALLGEIGGVVGPEQTVLSIPAAIPTACTSRSGSRPTSRSCARCPTPPRWCTRGSPASARALADDGHLAVAEEVLATSAQSSACPSAPWTR